MVTIDQLPFFVRLADSKNILICGAGGGADVYSALPIYLRLHSLGKRVILGNLTFSDLSGIPCGDATAVTEVTSTSRSTSDYFIEKYLSQWLERAQHSGTIQCFHRTGVKPLMEAYRKVVERFTIDTVILVDGGTDSLMRGDEPNLGTPQEDAASIAAVNSLKLERTYLLSVGFGIDSFHGVNHTLVLENIAQLIKDGGFIGAFLITKEMEEFKLYCEAVQYCDQFVQRGKSIVQSSIISSVEGEYGNFQSSKRTEQSKLWINPLMSIYWCFELPSVARNCRYLARILNTQTYNELSLAIESYRNELKDLRKIESPVW